MSELGRSEFDRLDFLKYAGVSAATLAVGAEAVGATAARAAEIGARAPEKTAVTIQYWTHDAALSVPFLKARAAELSASRKSKYKYTIKETINPDVTTKVRAAFAANSGIPDIINVDAGLLTPLYPIANKTLFDMTALVAQHRSDHYPNLWSAYTFNGHVYGLELAMSLVTYYYRQDEFKKLGLSAPPTTWAEVLEFGRKVAVPKGKYLGMVGSDSPEGAASGLSLFAIQNGGNFYNAAGKPTIDSPANIAALEFLTQAIKDKVFIAVDGQYGGPGIGALKSAAVIGQAKPDWYSKFILQPAVPEQADLWRMSGLPRFKPGAKNTSISGGSAFMIPLASKARAAALELVTYSMLTHSGQIKKFTEVGLLPTDKVAWKSPAVRSFSDPYMGGQNTGRLYSKLSRYAPIQHRTRYFTRNQEIINGYVLDAYNGKTTPRQALKDAQAAIMKLPQ